MLQAKTPFAPAGDRVEQGQREAGFYGVHPFYGGRGARNVVYHDRQHQHDLNGQHVIPRQGQHVRNKAFVSQHAAKTFAYRGFDR